MAQRWMDYAEGAVVRGMWVRVWWGRVRRVLPYVVVGLVCYVGSYVVLSVQGRYIPGGIGSNGVKFYDWAPRGFESGFRHRWGMYYFYLPLYMVDRWYWHDGDGYSGRYPTSIPATAAEWAEWRK